MTYLPVKQIWRKSTVWICARLYYIMTSLNKPGHMFPHISYLSLRLGFEIEDWEGIGTLRLPFPYFMLHTCLSFLIFAKRMHSATYCSVIETAICLGLNHKIGIIVCHIKIFAVGFFNANKSLDKLDNNLVCHLFALDFK